MDETRNKLHPDFAAAMGKELSAQVRLCFDKSVETNWRLVQHNFLVNAGGSAATLAYLGTEPTAIFAIWPLLCFLIGVVTSGVEIRSLLSIYGALYKDARRRHTGFTADKLSVKELSPSSDVAKCADRINQWSGWIAQAVFVVGVVVGVILYPIYAP